MTNIIASVQTLITGTEGMADAYAACDRKGDSQVEITRARAMGVALSATGLKPANDEGSGITYTPWTDGWAVGFEVKYPSGKVAYVYLNPSTTEPAEGYESDDSPCVFVYGGFEGDPATDDAITYIDTTEPQEV
jgi:hypothetical protein